MNGNDSSHEKYASKQALMDKTRFTEMLIEANSIHPNDFQSWVFCPGMLFNSADKWWGDRGRRDFPHEGIDFCLYEDRSGQILRIDEKTCIPVMQEGVVRAMFTDYLGQAVIIEHEHPRSETGTFLSAYAHTKPYAGIQPGIIVKEGDVIATIADTRQSKANILPHLHLTLGLPTPNLVYDPFVWNMMRDPELIVLLNPIGLIDWPAKVLDAHNYCRYER
jgi:murein DD-endopeptidase MepM/ murein hydrolase activator NlpD